ncbi:MFS transporter [Xylophilus rhododendri]|uniref:MFS transporter n=1 Tax=Xylophilus rhododendri TaxID=2697032 RepID=A0A857J6V0_9BURK|nr:MFS transporter [Xylophilus rhododendri]QHI98761.1 MFS transporter [Xylophilus rhododendri]
MVNPDIATADGERHDIPRISLALFLAGFSTFSLIYCVQPLLPEFSVEFGLTPASSSLALSLTTALLALSIVCAGMVSEAVGRRGLMFVSMGSAALLNLLASFAPNWQTLLVARALEGLVLGGVPAVAMAYLAEEVPQRRLGKVMGLYVGGTAFGGMMGRVAMGALTEFLSWRAAMGTLSVVAALSALAFIWLLPPSRHFQRQPGLNLPYHLAAWKKHLQDARLRPFFLVGVLCMGTFIAVYNYIGYRLVAAPYRLGQTALGLIFLAYVFGIFTSSAAGALVDRLGRARVIGCGALVSFFGLALTLADGLPLVIAGISLVTVGFFMVHSVASGAVGRLAQGHKGHASAIYLLCYYAGSSVLGSAAGALWRFGHWPAVAAFGGLMALGVLGVALALRAQDSAAPAALQDAGGSARGSAAVQASRSPVVVASSVSSRSAAPAGRALPSARHAASGRSRR